MIIVHNGHQPIVKIVKHLERMHMLMILSEGFIIGLAIAAPVGPIGVLCIQRSLHDGFRIGLMTGLGAALADGVYGCIAVFGLTAISLLLMTHQFWIRLIGGLFLLYLGIKTFFAKPVEREKKKDERSAWHALLTTFFLTLTNPATILSFIAIFAGLGLGTKNHTYVEAGILVASITLSSALWWLFLSGFVAFILHHRLSSSVIRGVNRLSGCIILAFALFALSQI